MGRWCLPRSPTREMPKPLQLATSFAVLLTSGLESHTFFSTGEPQAFDPAVLRCSQFYLTIHE